jgi:thiamine-monophosphate kinase
MNTTKRTEISSLGEFGLIDHITKEIKTENKESIKGIGNDRAILQFGNDEEVLVSTDLLLERAGYALSHASKQDIVVEYFIETQNYDIYTLNSVLFHLDLPTLGNVMK